MDAVRRLKDKFLKGGGTQADFESLGRGHLELGDTEHQDGSTRPNEARTLALKCFHEGALIQMSCYDGRGRSQGEAIVIFEKWIDKEELLFQCQHLIASNEYYEWWSTHEADFSKLVFHVCGRARNRCRTEAADGAETIHLTRWKMASPQTLIGSGFASEKAVEYFSTVLDYHLATMERRERAAPAHRGRDPEGEFVLPDPQRGKAPKSTGLDLAGAQADKGDERRDDEMVDELLAMAHEAKKDPGGKRKESKRDRPAEKGLSRLLAEKAAHRGEEIRERQQEKSKRKKKHGDDDEARLAKRKRLGVGESDSGDSSDSEAGFRVASSREVDLVRLSQKNPGCLLRSALKEMSRYLAARGEAMKEDPCQGKVVSYLHQILLPQYPKTGIRSHRELVTLASALDLLLEGNLGMLGDLLAQRFKAIEASLAADGNWAVARHQELIPVQASLSTKAELTEAAKAELRAQKLKAQLSRGGPSAAKGG